MTAVPELKTHWRLGKRGREEEKLCPTCLKTSSTVWWSGGFIRVTFKRINTEHWTVLTHSYGRAVGNMQLLQKYSQAGWESGPLLPVGEDGTHLDPCSPPAPTYFFLHLCSLCFSGILLPSLLPSPLSSPPPSLPCFSPFALSLAFLHLFPPSLRVVNDIISISLEYRGFKSF